MKRLQRAKFLVPVSLSVLLSVLFLTLPGCSKSNQPAWKAVSDKLVKENKIIVRERTDLVETGITRVSNRVKLHPAMHSRQSKLLPE